MSAASAAFLAEVQKRLAPFGVEGAAAEWLVKALHPAAPTSAPSFPDESYVESVRPEYRATEVIEAPAGLATPAWDLAVLRLPGDSTQVVWMSGNAGINFETDLGLSRGYIQLTGYTTADNISLSNFVPSATQLTLRRQIPSDGRQAWRTTYASLTAYMTASALNDQGTVYAAQIPRVPDRTYDVTVNGSTAPPMVIDTWSAFLPANENSLLLMSPKAYTAPAREGAYIPVRLNGPAQPYIRGGRVCGPVQDATATYGNIGAMSGALAIARAHPITTRLLTGFEFLGDGFDDYTYNYGYDNTSCAVMIFRGLSPNASITLKYYAGLELEVFADSVVRQFAVAPTPYTPAALQAYYRVVSEMPAVYPASFNALGTLATAIISAARRLWPMVRPVFAAGASAAAATAGRKLVEAAQPAPLSERQVVAMRGGKPAAKRKKRNRK